ncbi:hypothetical protein [Pseudalkalibacillus berkeleyi]|uniref:Uncharacterized protein n=1 Tax=Pseudalkalibacillus berkeleyi TaxID=1069813 RepID=A0ABS9GZ15_9BACL|nr:hypothetical protein [Pseudalkalibacillus berkeleyi]MCF6136733.1 hypothetical protein [Pseudalkalibacillus berkeleyi]
MNYSKWKGYSGWGEWYPRWPSPMETDPDDVTQMMFSAKSFITPTEELLSLLKTITTDQNFAHRLKKAAELNQNEQVKLLIKEKGVFTDFNVAVNPSGIRIEFKPDHVEACFYITFSLCW